MKKIKIISLLLAALILVSALLPASALAVSDPDISAKGAILVELGSGKVLYAKNEHEELSPASVTKVMTVLLAVLQCEERGIEDDIVTVGEDAYFDLTEDSSTQNLQPGEEIRFIDLMYCALVSSANEACNVIAQNIAGDQESFVEMMNDKAEELGCKNTHFVNTHGLTADGHYTSAWDMYLIFAEAQQHNLFRRICGALSYTVPATNMSDARALINTNKLLFKDNAYYSKYCIGGKTGYTDDAGYCLAALSASEDKTLVSVVLGAEAIEVDDGSYNIMSFFESKRLIDWGVDNFGWHTIVSEGEVITTADVLHGGDTKTIELCASATITHFTANDLSKKDIKYSLNLFKDPGADSFSAPITAGDVLGSAEVYIGDELCGTVRLTAKSGVRMERTEYITTRLKETLSQRWVKLSIVCLALLIVLYIALVIRSTVKRRKRALAIKKRKLELQQQRINEANSSDEPSRQISPEDMRNIMRLFGPTSIAQSDIAPKEPPASNVETQPEPNTDKETITPPSAPLEVKQREEQLSPDNAKHVTPPPDIPQISFDVPADELKVRERTLEEQETERLTAEADDDENVKSDTLIRRTAQAVSSFMAVVIASVRELTKKISEPSQETLQKREERKAARREFFKNKLTEVRMAVRGIKLFFTNTVARFKTRVIAAKGSNKATTTSEETSDDIEPKEKQEKK